MINDNHRTWIKCHLCELAGIYFIKYELYDEIEPRCARCRFSHINAGVIATKAEYLKYIKLSETKKILES